MRDIWDIKRQNRYAGYHFFDRDAMRFFGSRVHDEVYGSGFFVTSERYEDEPRRYTVRFATDDGRILDASGFQRYGSRSGAHAAAQRWAEAEAQGRVTVEGITVTEVAR